MTRHTSWIASFLYALSASRAVVGQLSTGSSTNPADGLSSAATATTTAQASVGTATINGSPTTYSVQFTVPAAADVGENLLPNVEDLQAVNAQDVCPGYKASGVERTENGFAALLTLAGNPVSIRPGTALRGEPQQANFS